MLACRQTWRTSRRPKGREGRSGGKAIGDLANVPMAMRTLDARRRVLGQFGEGLTAETFRGLFAGKVRLNSCMQVGAGAAVRRSPADGHDKHQNLTLTCMHACTPPTPPSTPTLQTIIP